MRWLNILGSSLGKDDFNPFRDFFRSQRAYFWTWKSFGNFWAYLLWLICQHTLCVINVSKIWLFWGKNTSLLEKIPFLPVKNYILYECLLKQGEKRSPICLWNSTLFNFIVFYYLIKHARFACYYQTYLNLL